MAKTNRNDEIEYGIGKGMDKVFMRQYEEAIKRQVMHTMDLDWVASKDWEDEIYAHTHHLIGSRATMAADIESRKLGVMLTDFIDRPKVQLALRNETYKFAQAVGKSSQNKLRATLVQGQKLGESIPQLTNRVKEVFEGVDPTRATSARAEMIARTESAQAYTVGTRQVWQETGVVQGATWLASTNACPFCEEMDGVEVRLDTPFFTVGQSLSVPYAEKVITMNFDYRDILGPPLHPQCRCVLLAKLIDIKGGED